MLRRVSKRYDLKGEHDDRECHEDWEMNVLDDVSFYIDGTKNRDDKFPDDFDGYFFSMRFKQAMEMLFMGNSVRTGTGLVGIMDDQLIIGDELLKIPNDFLDDCKKALIDAASDRVERFRTLRGEMQAIINRSKDNCHE